MASGSNSKQRAAHCPLYNINPLGGGQHRGVLRQPHAGDVQRGGRGLVLGAAPTRLSAGWLAYSAIRYELLGVSARYE